MTLVFTLRILNTATKFRIASSVEAEKTKKNFSTCSEQSDNNDTENYLADDCVTQ